MSLSYICERKYVSGVAILVKMSGTEESGRVVPSVKRGGGKISFSLLFYNSGKETLNVHGVFKCYRKRDGMLILEFATPHRKVIPEQTTEFIIRIDTVLLRPERYFIESAARFHLKYVEKSTKVLRKDFRVVE